MFRLAPSDSNLFFLPWEAVPSSVFRDYLSTEVGNLPPAGYLSFAYTWAHKSLVLHSICEKISK